MHFLSHRHANSKSKSASVCLGGHVGVSARVCVGVCVCKGLCV